VFHIGDLVQNLMEKSNGKDEMRGFFAALRMTNIFQRL
jgi:hypothetical protein